MDTWQKEVEDDGDSSDTLELSDKDFILCNKEAPTDVNATESDETGEVSKEGGGHEDSTGTLSETGKDSDNEGSHCDQDVSSDVDQTSSNESGKCDS